MRLEVPLPPILTLKEAWAAVEQAARELGLTCTLRRSSDTGSTHWHFKQGEKGVVEVTYTKLRCILTKCPVLP
jgi:hypothetical protein